MVSVSQFICLCSLLLTTKLASSQQSYDPTNCSDSQVPSSSYLCNSNKYTCQAFTLYRAQRNFQTLSSISSLFNLDHTLLLLPFNNLTEPTSHDLYPGQEIIVPLNCSCSGRFSQAVLMYNASASDTFPQIACGVFEGLLKPQTLVEHNPNSTGKNINGFQVAVPVRCACPGKLDRSNGVKYLVTYPILENDDTTLMAHKFGIPEELIWAANGLDQFSAVYPESTLLIPTKGIPYLNSEYTYRPDIPSPGPPTAVPLEKISPHKKARNLYVPLGIGALIMILFLVVASGFFILRKRHLRSFQPLSTKSSQMSSFSPDFLDGMSKLKHSLLNFSLEELRIATEDFSEASAIGTSVYRGRIGSSYIAIEQMSSEEAAHQVIEILTKINHINIVKLEGCCSDTMPYLVFEFAANGCLRDCLSNGKGKRELTWAKRIQIAFDLAVALHYMHNCTSPSHVHRNINSRNVLISMDWRAKISGFRYAKPFFCSEDNENKNWDEPKIVGRKGYLAPEYLQHRLVSPKVDIFAFGVVLLELISGREAVTNGRMLKDSAGFLAGGGSEGSSGCLEKLKEFMDPALEKHYALGDALRLALLAKGCVEENPHHRPNMNDALKVLSIIV